MLKIHHGLLAAMPALLLIAAPVAKAQSVSVDPLVDQLDQFNVSDAHKTSETKPVKQTSWDQTNLLTPTAASSTQIPATALPTSRSAQTASTPEPTDSLLNQVVQYSQQSYQQNDQQSSQQNQSSSVSLEKSGTNPTLNQISQYTNQNTDQNTSRNTGRNENQKEAGNSLAQLTSVTQLSDVRPTDWAYQALQSLVERYGCIVGYPDRTYRGQRALSRYEFAAGLNACLDRISQLIASSTADLATKEDLATLQRLQEEFATELASLRERVDTLESRTAQLEANQFSTTVKLFGDAFFVVADVFSDNDAKRNEAVFQYRYRATLAASFSGDDVFQVRLQQGNVVSFNQPGNEANLAANTNTNGNVAVDDLSYYFPITDNITGLVIANAASLDRLAFSYTISPFDVGAPRGSMCVLSGSVMPMSGTMG